MALVNPAKLFANKTRQGRGNNRRVELKIEEVPSSLSGKDTDATEETMEANKPCKNLRMID